MHVLGREAFWLRSHPQMQYGLFEEKQLLPERGRPAVDMLKRYEPFAEP